MSVVRDDVRWLLLVACALGALACSVDDTGGTAGLVPDGAAGLGAPPSDAPSPDAEEAGGATASPVDAGPDVVGTDGGNDSDAETGTAICGLPGIGCFVGTPCESTYVPPVCDAGTWVCPPGSTSVDNCNTTYWNWMKDCSSDGDCGTFICLCHRCRTPCAGVLDCLQPPEQMCQAPSDAGGAGDADGNGTTDGGIAAD